MAGVVVLSPSMVRSRICPPSLPEKSKMACPAVEVYLWWPEDLDERGNAGSPVYRVLR